MKIAKQRHRIKQRRAARALAKLGVLLVKFRCDSEAAAKAMQALANRIVESAAIIRDMRIP